jgi:hypothetical protein
LVHKEAAFAAAMLALLASLDQGKRDQVTLILILISNTF